MLLTRVRPSIWIPLCEVSLQKVFGRNSFSYSRSTQVTWSVLTILLAKCNNAQQIYALRFFVGL